jgi:hypothetical protein
MIILLFLATLNSVAKAESLDFAKWFFEQQQENYIREKVAEMNSHSQCNGSGIVYLYKPSTDLGLCHHKNNKCAIIYYNSIVYDFNGRETILTLANLAELEILRCATTEEMSPLSHIPPKIDYKKCSGDDFVYSYEYKLNQPCNKTENICEVIEYNGFLYEPNGWALTLTLNDFSGTKSIRCPSAEELSAIKKQLDINMNFPDIVLGMKLRVKPGTASAYYHYSVVPNKRKTHNGYYVSWGDRQKGLVGNILEVVDFDERSGTVGLKDYSTGSTVYFYPESLEPIRVKEQ